MRATSGHLAVMSAVGAGFLPLTFGPYQFGGEGVEQGDGTCMTVLAHRDGRTMTVRTERGNGWQRGRLVDAVAGGPWNLPYDGWRVHDWRGVRVWLNDHEPGREEPYCGGPWPRQPRALDGRERDILCRIIRDIERCCRDRDLQERLLSLVRLEGDEAYRLLEIATVLNARTD